MNHLPLNSSDRIVASPNGVMSRLLGTRGTYTFRYTIHSLLSTRDIVLIPYLFVWKLALNVSTEEMLLLSSPHNGSPVRTVKNKT